MLKPSIQLMPLTNDLILLPRRNFDMPMNDAERLVSQGELQERFGAPKPMVFANHF